VDIIERESTERPLTYYGVELDYLAVHPDNKGKEIGITLVESSIKQAEKMGVPIFSMAYKAGLGIYTRLGFKEVNRVI
jgi:N-acetylglutamate synthase-like GNAT family acetyltransferase